MNIAEHTGIKIIVTIKTVVGESSESKLALMFDSLEDMLYTHSSQLGRFRVAD